MDIAPVRLAHALRDNGAPPAESRQRKFGGVLELGRVHHIEHLPLSIVASEHFATPHLHENVRGRRALQSENIPTPPITIRLAGATNHLLSGQGSTLDASCIEVPVLAIHGTADPLFPIADGEAFTKVVPHARLHRIEVEGHEIHDRDIDEMVRAVADHTAPEGPEVP